MSARFRIATWLVVVASLIACGDDPTEPDSANPCSSATDIAMGQSVSNQLTVDDCRQPDGAYSDRWSLTLALATDVRIDLTSTAFDAFLEVRDRNGLVIASNDDFGSLNSAIVRRLAAGSYVIVARSLGPGAVGPYRLSVQPGPDCTPVGTLQLGQSVSGTLSATDCVVEWAANVDNWSLVLSAPQKLRIDLKSAAFDEVVLLRDATGEIVNGADWGSPTGHARLEMDVPAGDWTIAVTAGGSSQLGAYDLTVDLSPPCTPGTTLVIGETVSGEITSTDCLFDSYMPADSFAIVVGEETALDLHLKSAAFPPTMLLRNTAGDVFEFGWDSLGDGNARLRTTLQAGAYALFVFTGDYGRRGAYQLTVVEVVCTSAGALAVGTPVDGVLDASDCQRPGGAFRETWDLVLDADLTLRIDMVSAAFDALLIVQDDQGRQIAADDDGGQGVNARLDLALAAGRYVVVASAFGPNQVGAYRLTAGPPPAPSSVGRVVTPPPGAAAVNEIGKTPEISANRPELFHRGHARWPLMLGPIKPEL